MRRDVPAQSVRQDKREKTPPSSAFCSVRALNRLDDVHPHCRGTSTESTKSQANLTQK